MTKFPYSETVLEILFSLDVETRRKGVTTVTLCTAADNAVIEKRWESFLWKVVLIEPANE